MTSFYLGYLQFDVKIGRFNDNLARVESGLERLAPDGPGFVVLPELWAGGFDYGSLADHAHRTPLLLAELAKLAARHQVFLAGSLPEKDSDDQGRVYNTLYVVGPRGVVGCYRKQHLFAPMAEDRYFSAGDSPLPMSNDCGLVGGLVCYDLRFPELARAQVGRGARLLLVSAQWPEVRIDHWQALLKARAIENQVFIAACNRCGTTSNTTFGGHSMVVGPDGRVLLGADGDEVAAGLGVDFGEVDQIRSRFNTAAPAPYCFFDGDKVLELAELGRRIGHYKEAGQQVVFTNGCFDILHEGHVTYLQAARRKGDCLVVGLNDDASIRSIKGPDRPVNQQESRARVLAALGCVDHVVLFGADTPLELITTLLPDVLVKGADWSVETIVGAKEVIAAGGRVETISLVEKMSTSGLIERIRSEVS